jgi:hypothetical protein
MILSHCVITLDLWRPRNRSSGALMAASGRDHAPTIAVEFAGLACRPISPNNRAKRR